VETILPDYREFISLEDKTLKLIHNRLSQYRKLAHISGLVQKSWNCNNRDMFRFLMYWDVVYMDKDCRLVLGADVEKENRGLRIANSSYFICVIEGTSNPIKILRKFHFDYVTGRPDQRQLHPRFHLQYCGSLSPIAHLNISNELINPLEPDVDGPRVFFRPMTLGLLMNIVFHEFPCNDTEEIRNRGEWLNLVRENEKKVLVPFYEKCAQLAGNKDYIFFNEAYV